MPAAGMSTPCLCTTHDVPAAYVGVRTSACMWPTTGLRPQAYVWSTSLPASAMQTESFGSDR